MEFALTPELASLVEQAQILAFWRALFHIWSNTFYQNLNRTIDLQIYKGMVSEAPARAGQRSVVWAWESERFIYPDFFRNFMDSRFTMAASEPKLELLDSLERR
jgi:hypothetical protein